MGAALFEAAAAPAMVKARSGRPGRLPGPVRPPPGPGRGEQLDASESRIGCPRRSPSSRAGGTWYLGRPVMVTANDYGLRLFNGDTGVVVAREDGGVAVAFRRAEFAGR